VDVEDGGLGLHRLTANVAVTNEASHRVIQRAGFVRIGLERKSTLLPDGSWVDAVLYDQLAEDYEDPFGGSDTYSSIRLAGLRVAFVFTQISPDAGTTREVDRVDLGGGGKVSAKVARPVTLVMSRAGGVAWIESGAVSALGAAGGRSILDAGPVEPRSLRRAGRSGVSWLRDGTRHTAAVN